MSSPVRALSVRRRPARAPRRRGVRLLVAALAVASCAFALLPGSAGAQSGRSASYRNAVTDGYSIDFPDPTVIRGKDGYWYAYATGGPYDESGAGDNSKIARSADLTHWDKLGPIFSAASMPSWAVPTSGIWAPDIRYLDGRYVMYFVVPDTTVSSQGFDPGIGVATAPTPAGPWTDSGAPLVAPRTNAGGGYTTVIDPAEFTDTDGRKYLYYGGFDSGDFVVPLAADGMSVTGTATQVASTRFEGPYVIRHGDYYYLFGSSANCCAGPATGYTVFAGRSTSPLGPFTDADGVSMLASRSGGSIVVAPNGNRWIGTGHNAVVTDDAGQTWLAYHAIDRNRPYLDSSPGFTMRPMLLDRLDWIDGWPTVRAGAWASDSPQAAPVTRGMVDDRFGSSAATAAGFAVTGGDLQVQATDPSSDAGGFARLTGVGTGPAVALARRPVPRAVHAQADIRLASAGDRGGLLVRAGQGGTGPAAGVSVELDAAAHALTVTAPGLTPASTPLPAGVDLSVWHTLAVEVHGQTLTAEVSDAGQGDPLGTAAATLPRRINGNRAGLVGTGTADADNVSLAPLAVGPTTTAPVPEPGTALPGDSDDFTDGLGAGWTWVNQDPDATVTGGQLQWPTEDTDLSNAATDPGLLLRTPPTGDYLLETKLDLPVGTDTVRNFQQAGLVVYQDRKNFLRLDVVAAGTTRFVEFGKQLAYGDLLPFGGGIIGPPGDVTWLRIAKTTVPGTGEQRYQAGSSTDGTHWRWGMAWTLPAGSTPQIGLVSQGSSPTVDTEFGKANARFDYVHVSTIVHVSTTK